MPDKIGHYTIVSQLGRGGMGVVYKGHEESLNRYVAIKVLGEHLSEDQAFLTRFVREAQAAAGLSHPNIVQIFYIGDDDGKHYFVMEYVSGRSLHSMIREEGHVDNPAASQLMLQAAHGLAAAHDQGIIHRDIKPANLMLDPRGMIKIADFGLALPVESQTRLTATGMLMGTPGYLAPEQCRSEDVDHRTDIYALGVTYFELLTGQLPFKADSPLALLKQILDEDPPDIASLNPSVDPESRRILAKMIEKDREARYQDCHHLAADLEEYIHTKGVRSVTHGLAVTPVPRTAPGTPSREPALNVHADHTPLPGAPTAVTPSGGSGSPTAVTPAAGVSEAPTVVTPAGGVAEAPTVVTSAGGDDAPTLQTAAPRVPDVPPPPPAAAPVAQAPSASPPAPTPAAAPPSTSPPQKTSSSKGLLIAAILAVFIVGGASAAFVAWKFIAGGDEVDQVATGLDTVATSAGDAAISPAGLTEGAIGENSGDTSGGVVDPTDGQAGEVTTQDDGSGIVAGDRGGDSPASTRGTSDTTTKSAAVADVSKKQSQQKVAPPPPPLSGTMVAVTGDQALTPYVSEIMMTELSAVGVRAEDASALPGWDDLVRQDPQTAYLLDQVQTAGFAELVLVRVDPTGQRRLNYMGRSDTAYSARVTIQRYDVASGRPVGQRATTTVEYTQLNAQSEAEKKVGPAVRQFTSGL